MKDHLLRDTCWLALKAYHNNVIVLFTGKSVNVSQGLFVLSSFYPDAEPCSSPPGISVAELEISESPSCALCVSEKTVNEGNSGFGSLNQNVDQNFACGSFPFSVWDELGRS